MVKQKYVKKPIKKYRKKSMPKTISPYRMPTMIKRTCLKFDATLLGGPLSLDFRLSDLPNNSDFSNLFDLYKIKGVKLKIIPTYNSNDTGVTNTLAIPIFHYCIDLDDASSFSSEIQALERDNIKTRRLDKPINVYFKPRVNNVVFNTTLVNAYSVGKNQWLDMNQTGIPHFGFKSWIQTGAGGTSTPIGVLKVYATFYLAFKGAQ